MAAILVVLAVGLLAHLSALAAAELVQQAHHIQAVIALLFLALRPGVVVGALTQRGRRNLAQLAAVHFVILVVQFGPQAVQ